MPEKKKKDAPRPQNKTKSKTYTPAVRESNGHWKKGFSASPEHKFPPGVSGNPGGRPKDLTKRLREQLMMKVPDDPHKRTYLQLLIFSGVKRAIDSSDVLFKEIFDRMDGKLVPDPEDRGLGGGRVEVIILNSPRPGDPAQDPQERVKLLPSAKE